MVTHKDIARALGVTQSTVSRALDPAQRHQIGPAMRAKVLATVEKLGFRPNALARRLRRGRAETLTVVIPGEVGKPPAHPDFESGNPALMWEEVHGIMHAAARRGYEVKLMPQFHDDALLTRYFTSHIGYPYSDGVIFAGLSLARQKSAASVLSLGIPCLATVAYPESLPMPLIAIDQRSGVSEALAALLAAGHRHIAFIAFAQDYATSATWRPRYETFTTTLMQAGVLDQATFLCAGDIRSLRQTLASLDRPLPFTAAFCVNDALASHVVQIVRERVTGPPVTVVGFDDSPLYHRAARQFPSVSLPLHELGRRAVERLIDHIEEPETPLAALEVVPTRFVP